ncbi:MAG: LysR substrate-binding domain-containing protein [Alphaproteobacteria bacterium]
MVVTVPDFIGSTWLVPKLKEFRDAHPDIRLTILFEDRVLDLSLREADIALRLHIRRSKPTLSGGTLKVSASGFAPHGIIWKRTATRKQRQTSKNTL